MILSIYSDSLLPIDSYRGGVNFFKILSPGTGTAWKK